MDIEKHSLLIDLLGGTGSVARECGISSQAVSRWRRNGIPGGWLRYFQLAHPESWAQCMPSESIAGANE